ncbi:MAG: heme exporter protein CcmD [Pyrinomonadaceae bacterium]
MHWLSWSDFFSMGGYGFYVWGSYGITFALLAGEVLMLWKRKRNLGRRVISHIDAKESHFKTSLQESQ